MLEKFFHFKERGTNIKTELIAGLVTFLSMSYILVVNPLILSASGMDYNSVCLATAIASGIASILMGLLANLPVALSAGMGVNALFSYTLCLGLGYTWQEALAVVFISGILFVLITITGLRKIFIQAIPKNLKYAIGAGIGFFIAFIGLKNAGIVVADASTAVALGSFTQPQVVLALFGILITLFFVVKKFKAGVFWGLFITIVLGLIMTYTGFISTDITNNPLPSFASFSFTFDFNMPTFGAFLEGFKTVFQHSDWILMVFTFLYADALDTSGTLISVCNATNLTKEDGSIEGIEGAFLADAIGTVVGAMLGTSTVTSFVESGSGVASGGRTGLAAITTGILFFLSIIFAPLLSIVTSSVTTPALFVVGVLMAMQLKNIEWDNFGICAAAFTTILTMVLGYSIANGISLGFLVYSFIFLIEGKMKEIHPIIWILDIIFILYFVI